MATRSIAALSVSLLSFALASSARAETPSVQVIAQTPTGQVVAEGCSSVVVDPHGQSASAGTVACPPVPPPPAAAEATAKPKKKWYGWQTLTTDGAALAMLYAAGRSDSDSSSTFALLALGTYALGAPVVHAANGSAGKMGISLGMRVGAPVVLGYGLYALSSSSSSSRDDWGPAIMGGLGIVGGMIASVVVDATVLARKNVTPDESEKPPQEEPPQQAAKSFHITPSVAPTRGGGTIGAIGTF